MKPRTLKISSRNAAFQIFAALKRNRNKRKQYGKIIVEGVIPINLCVESEAMIQSILIEDGKTLSRWAQNLLATVPCETVYSVSKTLMSELSDKDDSSELLVIAGYPQQTLSALEYRALKRIVVLDRPSSPGNLGAIIRSCDAFGIDAVLLTGHSVDAYDPKTITASRGTVFTVPAFPLESNVQLQELLIELKTVHHHFHVYGSSANYGSDFRAMRLAPNFGLIIGNETHGMSDFLKSQCDDVLSIDMLGAASSLNVACATSIMLYELTKLQ
jgi:TrmH family RNA methyltransferase